MNLLACLISLFATTLANTEKVIFLAPSTINLPDTGPLLQTLRLDIISSENSTLKKALPVAFPTQDNPRGLESWYLLAGLNAAQRYELRICWPAVVCTFLLFPSTLPHSWLMHDTTSRFAWLLVHSSRYTSNPRSSGWSRSTSRTCSTHQH